MRRKGDRVTSSVTNGLGQPLGTGNWSSSTKSYHSYTAITDKNKLVRIFHREKTVVHYDVTDRNEHVRISYNVPFPWWIPNGANEAMANYNYKRRPSLKRK